MTAIDTPPQAPPPARTTSPFDLDDDAGYGRWRAWKLAYRPVSTAALTVAIADPRALRPGERAALLDRISRASFAVYRSPVIAEDKDIPRLLGAQLGLHRLDANWLADEDGISSIAISKATDGRGGFIPYTDRAIRWHTDGYYHPAERRIRGMILHCVRPAASGGVNGLFDHELAYLRLRDLSPAHVRALTQPDVMTIPARTDDDGVARAAQTGPVFSVDDDGSLHMRYTARTRSIEWKDDATTRAAVAALEGVLEGVGGGDAPGVFHLRLQPGMGIVGHNVLHDRTGFNDDPAHPRLLYRARFLDRTEPPAEAPWRNG
ncbi:MAG: TauD/TfdA family dioxygenase [Rubrivivax sp.]|nr:TauD/TfdA family dioxygenase [Rubrivivax sp.]